MTCNLSNSYGGGRSMRDSCAVSGTTTYSISLGLAKTLQERGIEAKINRDGKSKTPPALKTTAKQPRRFQSIVTETLSDSRHSQTEAVYSTPTTPPVLLKGISNTAQILLDPRAAKLRKNRIPTSPAKGKDEEPTLKNICVTAPIEQVLSNTAQPLVISKSLNLLDKIKDSGLDKSGSTTAAQVVLNTGLNSILSEAGRKGLLTRIRASKSLSVIPRIRHRTPSPGDNLKSPLTPRGTSSPGLGLLMDLDDKNQNVLQRSSSKVKKKKPELKKLSLDTSRESDSASQDENCSGLNFSLDSNLNISYPASGSSSGSGSRSNRTRSTSTGTDDGTLIDSPPSTSASCSTSYESLSSTYRISSRPYDLAMMSSGYATMSSMSTQPVMSSRPLMSSTIMTSSMASSIPTPQISMDSKSSNLSPSSPVDLPCSDSPTTNTTSSVETKQTPYRTSAVRPNTLPTCSENGIAASTISDSLLRHLAMIHSNRRVESMTPSEEKHRGVYKPSWWDENIC